MDDLQVMKDAKELLAKADALIVQLMNERRKLIAENENLRADRDYLWRKVHPNG